MDAEKKAELLMDHYKDTFQLILYHWKLRNRLFVYVLIVLALLGLDACSPGTLSQFVNAYIANIAKKAENPPDLQFRVIETVSWFLLLSLVIQYYQRSIFVDREYRYIQRLEEQICREMGGDYVSREGRSYFSRTGRAEQGGKQPLFIRRVGPIYVYAFPIVLMVFVGWKVVRDCCPPGSVLEVLNIIICAVLIAYNIFYLRWVMSRS